MNLFWKNLFGGLASTDKFERQMKQLADDMRRYTQVEKSAELAEYNELAHVVNAPEFQEKKNTLENRRYRDTEEYRDRRKVKKLAARADIRQYYDVLRSQELKDFLAFMETPEAQHLNDRKAARKSPELQRFRRFAASKAYRVYTRLHDAYLIKEYEALLEKVASDEFQEADRFWSDPHRWQHTPEYQQEQRYNTLAANPDIAFFLAEKPERFNAWRALARSFDDEFNWNVLSASRWTAAHHHGPEALRGDHSYTNERQAMGGVDNVSVVDGHLRIATRRQPVTARAWDATKGFVMQPFDYTSAVMQTAADFRQQYGIFQAKLRCTGRINHACWLGGDGKLPVIKLFHYDGKVLRPGFTDGIGTHEARITGINPAKFHVYTLVWTPAEMAWYVNNLQVLRCTTRVPQEALYLALQSFIASTQKPQEGLLEADWVRVYTDGNPSSINN